MDRESKSHRLQVLSDSGSVIEPSLSQLHFGPSANNEILLGINSSAACWENVSASRVSRTGLRTKSPSDLVSELISTLSLWSGCTAAG